MSNNDILDKILLVIKLERMINTQHTNITIKNIRDRLNQLNNDSIYINCIIKLEWYEKNNILNTNISDNDKKYGFEIQDIKDKIGQLNNDYIFTNYISKLREKEKYLLKMNDDKELENILKDINKTPDYSMKTAQYKFSSN